MSFERISQTMDSQAAVTSGPTWLSQNKIRCGQRPFGGTGDGNHQPGVLGRGLQARLRVGNPNDGYEREADRVADRIVKMPGTGARTRGQYFSAKPVIQRRMADAGGVVETVPPEIEDSMRSPGQPLDKAALDYMEPRFGYDFSGVRVHLDSWAEASADAIGAKAFTVGRHIVFGSGRYTPGTSEGKRLLAHELTHVVQQGNDGGKTIQRDLAIAPPRPNAVGRALSAAEMDDAIDFNNRVLGSIANSVDIIRMIRDVIGISPLPAVVDEDFVNGVVQWQANFGLGQDGRLGPRTARPLFREIGAEGVGRGEVSRSPRYVPAGPINVPRAVPRRAHFDMSAEFRSDPTNGIFPSCCEVRQEIQWDAAFVAASVAAGAGTVPHTGFPAAHTADTWIEDRDPTGNRRLGYRSGRFAEGIPGNRYIDPTGRVNQAFGYRYEGSDDPTGFATDRGSWRFRLGVYDMCNGNRLLEYSPTLVVNWL
jgi:hypothetical protein